MDYFKRTKVSDVLKGNVKDRDDLLVLGWVRTKRVSKNIAFIEINDGSTLENLRLLF